ncbi:craniofacial development protein 2-like [Bos javanicus]|uniref:craniofacial development protein 2-like n=1 Tax=Bos javanicus TaxID=9906 RepID=UPI002AA877E2|nr:craniofacial development protein 2-like [Bos javanicus]XP_061280249.1 craniofacial development protein 2-like [Bos javanicus]XP_061280250.1 craniofacial development protein 2-like [Bos javanicus]
MDLEFYVLGLGLDGPLLLLDYQGCTKEDDQQVPRKDAVFRYKTPVIQDYAPATNDEEAEVERFYEDLQDLLEIAPTIVVVFIIRDWNAKVESQEIPGITGEFGLGVQNEAGRGYQSFAKRTHSNTLFQQHKRRLYTWTSPVDQYWNQIDYILCN